MKMNQDYLTDSELPWGDSWYVLLFIDDRTDEHIEEFADSGNIPIPSEGERVAFHTYINEDGEQVHRIDQRKNIPNEREYSVGYRVSSVTYTYAKGVEIVEKNGRRERANEYRIEVRLEELS